jgi:RES domain
VGGDVSGASTLPDPPAPHALRSLGIKADETRLIGVDEVWWRVHRTEGAFVPGWNAFRTYGPVWYGASTPDVALGEAFRVDRTIDRALGRPYLTGLSFIRPLTVLDLAADSVGAWATRVGGTFAISTGPHALTQQWARAIVTAFPDLDGLRYNSRFAGGPCLALFPPAQTAMPARPRLSQPLDHPDLVSHIAAAASRLGYTVI